MKKIIVVIVFSFGFLLGWSQSEGEMRGDGIVIPSLTTTERNAISSPDEGHLIYNESTDELQVRRNGAWQALGSGGGGGATSKIEDPKEMNTSVSAIDADPNYVQLTVEGDASWYWYYNADGDIRVDIVNKENSDNTFIGEGAGQTNTLISTKKDGWQNTFLGNEAGSQNSTGSYNTFVGKSAGRDNNTADNNTFVGRAAGDSFTSGAHNTVLGSRALSSGTSATRNVAIGSEAGLTSVASDNIFIGYQSGRNGTDSGAEENVGIGTEALQEVGKTSGGSNQSKWNAAVGFQAGKNTDLGYNNVFMGKDAGELNSGGYNNTFVGYTAGEENTSGHHNTYLGDNAGSSIADGSYNVMIGSGTGNGSSGMNNAYIGENAGKFNAGSGNVFIGHEAGWNVSGGPIQDASNTLVITNDPEETLIYGEFDNKIVRIDGEAQVETNSLNLRYLGGSDSDRGLVFSEDENRAFGLIYDGAGSSGSNRLHLREYVGSSTSDIMTFKGDGKIGIGDVTPNADLEIANTLRLTPTNSRPTCNSTYYGMMYFDDDDDTLYICLKDKNKNLPPDPDPGWLALH